MTSPDPICWESNVTNTTTTLCYGAGNKCNENCWVLPYDESQNATIVAENEAICRELNNCDEIYAEEQLSVNACSALACEGVPKIPSSQSAMIILGLLLLLLSGTVFLNCYKEAVAKPKCSPCKEAGGRICLYGSNIGAFVLIFVVIAQLVTYQTNSESGGGWYDLIIVVTFIYFAVINAMLVLCACLGRALLAKEEGEDNYDNDSSDNERGVNVEEGVAVAVPVVEQTNPVSVKAVLE